jgi:hypothetical protein
MWTGKLARSKFGASGFKEPKIRVHVEKKNGDVGQKNIFYGFFWEIEIFPSMVSREGLEAGMYQH